MCEAVVSSCGCQRESKFGPLLEAYLADQASSMTAPPGVQQCNARRNPDCLRWPSQVHLGQGPEAGVSEIRCHAGEAFTWCTGFTTQIFGSLYDRPICSLYGNSSAPGYAGHCETLPTACTDQAKWCGAQQADSAGAEVRCTLQRAHWQPLLEQPCSCCSGLSHAEWLKHTSCTTVPPRICLVCS